MTETTAKISSAVFRQRLAETFQGLFSPFTIFIWFGLILLATVAGPFGTLDGMSTGVRLLFWVAVISVSVPLGYLIRAITATIVDPRDSPRFDCFAIVLMTLVFTPVLAVLSAITTHFTGVATPGLALMTLYVFVTCLVVFGLRRLAPGFEPMGDLAGEEEAMAASPAAVVKPQPRLMRRICADLHGDVVRLTASGHFVEVVTTRGSEHVRMRLSDAILEMEPEIGYCVHRSHWVTHAAIEEVVRENAHKSHIVLSNGDRVPVSRKYRPNLVEAGLCET